MQQSVVGMPESVPRASLQRRDSLRKHYGFGGKQRVRYETETPSPQIVPKEDVTEGLLPRASNVGCEQAEFKTRKRDRDGSRRGAGNRALRIRLSQRRP